MLTTFIKFHRSNRSSNIWPHQKLPDEALSVFVPKQCFIFYLVSVNWSLWWVAHTQDLILIKNRKLNDGPPAAAEQTYVLISCTETRRHSSQRWYIFQGQRSNLSNLFLAGMLFHRCTDVHKHTSAELTLMDHKHIHKLLRGKRWRKNVICRFVQRLIRGRNNEY